MDIKDLAIPGMTGLLLLTLMKPVFSAMFNSKASDNDGKKPKSVTGCYAKLNNGDTIAVACNKKPTAKQLLKEGGGHMFNGVSSGQENDLVSPLTKKETMQGLALELAMKEAALHP